MAKGVCGVIVLLVFGRSLLFFFFACWKSISHAFSVLTSWISLFILFLMICLSFICIFPLPLPPPPFFLLFSLELRICDFSFAPEGFRYSFFCSNPQKKRKRCTHPELHMVVTSKPSLKAGKLRTLKKEFSTSLTTIPARHIGTSLVFPRLLPLTVCTEPLASAEVLTVPN